jgi:hypothetical protein
MVKKAHRLRQETPNSLRLSLHFCYRVRKTKKNRGRKKQRSFRVIFWHSVPGRHKLGADCKQKESETMNTLLGDG